MGSGRKGSGMRYPERVGFLVGSILLSGELLGAGQLRVLDKPLWIFGGQTFRIAVEQPTGSGRLDVRTPPTLEMFDTWPKDAIQRFYFRALKPGDATLRFHGKAGRLQVPLEVIPWSDLYKPRKFRNVALPRIWPLGETEYRHIKKRHTFYTAGQLKAMRRRKAGVHATAQQWLGMSDEEIWNIIPGPCVPRTCLIVLGGGGREDARGKGCPVCGMKVYEGRSAFYPWIFDPKGHPWKVGCCACGSWFPSNDWHKGDMHSGDFPDDGFGCEPARAVLSPSGVPWRWPFIAYYHQWQAYMRTFTPGIERCAAAYGQTGDRRYAHKAAVGLLRYAESMLDLSVNLNHRKMAVRDAILRWPVGAPQPRSNPRHTFLYIQPNWDTPRMEALARAWDMIFDAVAGDAELLAFCRRHHHPEIETPEDLRRFVEAGVIRVPIQAALDDAVSRNYPMQEVALATMALVLDSPRCLDLVDWLLNDGAGIRFALANQFFKDGSAYESESYNAIHIRDMERIFDLLERIRRLHPDPWKKRRFVAPYADPKYRRLYDFPIENSLIGCATTWTGDTGKSVSAAARPPMQAFPLQPRDFVNVYRQTRDPRFAQVLYGPDGRIPSELREPDLRAEVAKVGKQRGRQVRLKSNVLDGYGHAILRSGQGDRRRALWLRYGRCVQHVHNDLLTMGLAALRREMLPELGYPQGWTYAGRWAANWGTHYGTHITGVPTWEFGRGALTLFADTPPARAASATAQAPWGKAKAMRSRTIVLVDLSPRDCYAVTLERVWGGAEHTLSFHGPPGVTTPVGLKLTARKGGTVLGAEAKYRDFSSILRTDPELACLAFLTDVRRARPKGLWGIDYALEGQNDVHLRVTMLAPEGCDLALAQGKPAQGRKSYEMTWAVLQRKGAAPLASQFLTVLEPFEGQRLPRKVERLKLSADLIGRFPPVAIRIISKEFVDTIILQPESPTECAAPDGISCDGELGFWRERDGKLIKAVLVGGTKLQKKGAGVTLPAAAYHGRIKSCDWRNRTLILEPKVEDPAAMAGRHVRIRNEAGSDASYLIQGARSVEGGWQVTLGLDARIGEGFVRACENGAVVSATTLRFAGHYRYYAGKTIANEDASVAYRLRDVHGMKCAIDDRLHGKVPAGRLRAELADKDGDARPRFVICDYGPGDRVTVTNHR